MSERKKTVFDHYKQTQEYKAYEEWEFGLKSRFGEAAAYGIVEYLMFLSASAFGGVCRGSFTIPPTHPADVLLFEEAQRGLELMRKIPHKTSPRREH
jgi:hypothetical protein